MLETADLAVQIPHHCCCDKRGCAPLLIGSQCATSLQCVAPAAANATPSAMVGLPHSFWVCCRSSLTLLAPFWLAVRRDSVGLPDEVWATSTWLAAHLAHRILHAGVYLRQVGFMIGLRCVVHCRAVVNANPVSDKARGRLHVCTRI